ncbi:MAG: LysM domain-containing protein [Microbacteriaceae bacterium]
MFRSLAGAGLVVVLLAGCSMAGSSDPESDSQESIEPATQVVPEREPVTPPLGVAASGALVTAEGADLGQVHIDRTERGYALRLPEEGLSELLATQEGRLHVAFSDGEIDFGQCPEANLWQHGADVREPAFARLVPDESGQDPTYWKAVSIVSFDDPAAEPCWQSFAAIAQLEWTTPVARPWVDPVDAGESAQARGTVEERDGAPVLYRTASGDDWAAIAERFGMDSTDLTWLNPIRYGNAEPETAYAGQVLNLDPVARGDSETRRPR